MSSGSARPLLGIVGAGRNGSTLLARLLDGSPALWLHPVDIVYLQVFDEVAATGRATVDSIRAIGTRPLGHLNERVAVAALVEALGFQLETIEPDFVAALEEPYERIAEPLERLDVDGRATAAEFLPAWLESVRRAYDTRPGEPAYLGFKTAETRYVDDYARCFPDARFVHIVRDPLTNYSSFKRTVLERGKQPFWTAKEDILWRFLEVRWLPHARAIPRLLRDAPERHLLVRYEDLCRQPHEEVARICAWLDVEPPAEPDLQTVLGGRRLRSQPHSTPSKPGLETPARVVAGLQDSHGYEDNVTAREAALIGHAVGRYAHELGYDRLPERGRARLWLSWLPLDRWETLNVDRRAWKRWLLEIVKRRVYVTRRLLAR